MKPEEDYIAINKASWNKRTAAHVDSEFYDMDSFKSGDSSLNTIELPLLGDLTNKKVLHLQCHFGQDTISMTRMGASCVGVDLSDDAIAKAKQLAEDEGANATFICSDVYALPEHLDEKFDIVYTSYGTIGWLPDLNKWANVVDHFLKPGGKFVFAEFHPVIWMFDNDFSKIEYRYFTSAPIVETESGTYADKNAPIEYDCITWNHGLGEVVNSLLNKNLKLIDFQEYDYSPYPCFNKVREVGPKQFRIEHLDDKIPMVYSLVMVKE